MILPAPAYLAEVTCQAADIPAYGQHPVSVLPIVDRIRVPVGPAWLGAGFGSVWLSKSDSKSVLRIDPATGHVVARIAVGSDPELGIGVGMGFAATCMRASMPST
jgi:streptogramin lyase